MARSLISHSLLLRVCDRRLQLADKVALVTGVGPSTESGSVENIGLAVATRLLLEGAWVFGTDVLDGSAALAAAADSVVSAHVSSAAHLH